MAATSNYNLEVLKKLFLRFVSIICCQKMDMTYPALFQIVKLLSIDIIENRLYLFIYLLLFLLRSMYIDEQWGYTLECNNIYIACPHRKVLVPHPLISVHCLGIDFHTPSITHKLRAMSPQRIQSVTIYMQNIIFRQR